ncbi:Type III restriction enzyme, res subunit family protein [Trichomonas vaginalis G3]|uniref:ATP-dependent RNA helicase n=1 Tax=Trichomonas vaginalis (strain ATCC PRA-98 / G3) TaxID=412133 RepID=A2ETP7_TRIV3|nr:helicase protein [Trichomonas vaginalis G3]EAY03928.1 Type III restriction enzyme, res subunit family protein [Trichomonas vaginalis G3]KAI5541066.1 helicase protein [Trichomonas vaginalis G3]|eukprot:XP_001316151.1 Type III restriction enzyme, res subunit family protein [Trichomonas vaginalis G3]
MTETRSSPLETGLFSDVDIKAADIDSRLMSVLEKKGFSKLTNIQAESIKAINNSRDALICANTGTGKTLSYLLPIFTNLAKEFPDIKREMGCLALIVVPTRELCLQIETVVQDLRSKMNFIVAGTLLGGEQTNVEKKALRKGLNVIITTPGRLTYHLQNSQNLTFDYFRYFVLDEADRLLSEGFQNQLVQIINLIKGKSSQSGAKYHSILVSATLTSSIESLSSIALSDPVRIGSIISKNYSVPDSILQRVVSVELKDKLLALLLLLKKYYTQIPEMKAIVFLSTISEVDFYATFFSYFNFLTPQEREDKGLPPRKFMVNDSSKPTIRDHHPTTDNDEVGGFSPFLNAEIYKLHGNLEQTDRNKTISKYTASKDALLFCTNVAARGIDIPDVQLIVQYEAPVETEDYVHRIGRTARIGEDGVSYLFLQDYEMGFVNKLTNMGIKIKNYNFSEIVQKGVSAMKGRNLEKCTFGIKMEIFSTVKSNNLSDIACYAWQSAVQSYRTYRREDRVYFDSRKLHLGHLANVFGLEKTPSQISDFLNEDYELKKSLNEPVQKKEMLPAFEEQTSEFI